MTAESLRAAIRRSHDAATRFGRATAWLAHEAEQTPLSRSRRWLIGYAASKLLGQALGDAETLLGLMDGEVGDGEIEEIEVAVRSLHDALRARRLASKLEQVDGRTPEEAEAFLAKARTLRER